MVNAWVFTAGNMDKCLIIIRSQKGKNLFWCHTGMFSFSDSWTTAKNNNSNRKHFSHSHRSNPVSSPPSHSGNSSHCTLIFYRF